MKGRRPRQDELDLWRRVTEQTTKLRKDTPPQLQEQTKRDETPQPEPKPALKSFRVGEASAPSLRTSTAPVLQSHPTKMDAKAFTKLKRGKLVPEARIDLHGMTLERAHPALSAFVLSSFAAGRRLVLVITGKGRSGRDDDPIPRSIGALRREVPHWLAMPPLSSVVLEVVQAHGRHGGGGAYYVYLRRQRS